MRAARALLLGFACCLACGREVSLSDALVPIRAVHVDGHVHERWKYYTAFITVPLDYESAAEPDADWFTWGSVIGHRPQIVVTSDSWQIEGNAKHCDLVDETLREFGFPFPEHSLLLWNTEMNLRKLPPRRIKLRLRDEPAIASRHAEFWDGFQVRCSNGDVLRVLDFDGDPNYCWISGDPAWWHSYSRTENAWRICESLRIVGREVGLSPARPMVARLTLANGAQRELSVHLPEYFEPTRAAPERIEYERYMAAPPTRIVLSTTADAETLPDACDTKLTGFEHARRELRDGFIVSCGSFLDRWIVRRINIGTDYVQCRVDRLPTLASAGDLQAAWDVCASVRLEESSAIH